MKIGRYYYAYFMESPTGKEKPHERNPFIGWLTEILKKTKVDFEISDCVCAQKNRGILPKILPISSKRNN